MTNKHRFWVLVVGLLLSIIAAGFFCYYGYELFLTVWETVKGTQDLNGGLIILCAIPGIIMSLLGVWLLLIAKTAVSKAQRLSANYEITALKADLETNFNNINSRIEAAHTDITKTYDLVQSINTTIGQWPKNETVKGAFSAVTNKLQDAEKILHDVEVALEQKINTSKQELEDTIMPPPGMKDPITQQLMIIEKVSNSEAKDKLYASLVQTLSGNPVEQSTPPAPQAGKL